MPKISKTTLDPVAVVADWAYRNVLDAGKLHETPLLRDLVTELRRVKVPEAVVTPALCHRAARMNWERDEAIKLRWLEENRAGVGPVIVVDGDPRFDEFKTDPVAVAERLRRQEAEAERSAKLESLKERQAEARRLQKAEREASQARQAELKAARQKLATRDKRLPKPGTDLVKRHGGKEVRIRCLLDGFEHAGKVHASLSAAVQAATGETWNGFKFFNL